MNAIEGLILFHGPESVAAVVADPIPGNAAVPGPGYWPRLREICTRYGVVLIGDEVTTAWGRTGKMFALEHLGGGSGHHDGRQGSFQRLRAGGRGNCHWTI